MCVLAIFQDPPRTVRTGIPALLLNLHTQIAAPFSGFGIASLGIKNRQEIAAHNFERSDTRAALKFRNG